MTDIVDASTRSRMMSGIRNKDTRQELEIRKRLFALGFRYRLHDGKLPGKPDLIFPRYKAVIFIHGCFWHAHDCALFKWPGSRRDFWKKKLTGNKRRDEKNRDALLAMGWRVMTIWECALRGAGNKKEKKIDTLLRKTVKWLYSKSGSGEIRE
jgi:DNA mismatch endonuclease, patch repair protein